MAKRPWEPFKVIPIRLMATNKMVDEDVSEKAYGRRNAKTKSNALDTVRGCVGGKTNNGYGCPWGCYSCESMKRFHRIFHIPVSMMLKEHLLRRDLDNCPDSWIRIGVNGEPGEDWPLTIRVCRIIQDHGKTPVVLTRLWNYPTPEILRDLAETGAVLQVSSCALDSDFWLSRAKDVINTYTSYKGLALLRLVTFVFKDPELMKKQEQLYHWGGFILEQPARLQRTNPTWETVDQDKYKPYHDYTTGKSTNRWWTAGTLFDGPTCGDGCYKCANKCYTNVGDIKKWIKSAAPALLSVSTG